MDISNPPVEGIPLTSLLIGLGLLVFFAILFLQSGLDKVMDFRGNRDWLEGQFSKTIFNGLVPLLLVVLTIMEVGVGIGSVGAAIFWVIGGTAAPTIAYGVCAASTATLLMLFLGQRVAKDYGGAAGIVPYFITSILAMIFFALF